MEIVFVVLVLFVGCSSGVIVPGVVLKAINETTNSNKSREIKMEMNLENSNKIDEKELFQTTADKANSLNERSFIFINQRFQTLLRNQLHNSQTHNLNKPFTISERLPQVNVIPPSSKQVKISSLKHLFIPNIKITQTDAWKPWYSPNDKSYLGRELKTKLKDNHTLQKAFQEDVHTKPADRKPLSKNTVDNNEHKIVNYSSKGTIKQHLSKIMKPQEAMSNAHHRISYNFGFPAQLEIAQGRSLFRNNDLPSIPEDISSEDKVVTDKAEKLSPLDLNEDDKLLERYIKETLEEYDVKEVTNDEPSHKKCQKCKGNKTKQSSNAVLNCKCEKNDFPYSSAIVHIQRTEQNKYEGDESKIPTYDENDKLFAYSN